MEGQKAPELEMRNWIGTRPPALAELRGQPVLLMFWARYCEDSRAQGRVLVRIKKQFDRAGLVLIGPTRRYGYLDERRRHPARPRTEKQHIKQMLDRYYADLSGMPVPISERDFAVYGVSTTPTLVLVGREGLVELYHPGKAPYRYLVTRVRNLLNRSH